MVHNSKPILKVTVDQSPFNMVDLTDKLEEMYDNECTDIDSKLTENCNQFQGVVQQKISENCNQIDTISMWFVQGFYHILEKVFLELDPEDKASCARVSASWRDIVEYFYESSNPRYKLHLDQKLSRMWNNTDIKHQKLEDAYAASGFNVYRPIDLVMDDLHLVVTVLVEKKDPEAKYNGQTKIMILECQDYSLVRMLDVDSMIGFQNRNPVFVKLEMNRDYLFANVSLNIGGSVQLMFDRNSEYDCQILNKNSKLGPNDFDSEKNFSSEGIPKPILMDKEIKIPVMIRNYSNCTVTTHLEFGMDNLSQCDSYETVLKTKLPKVGTIHVPASKNILVREFDFRNDYLGKLAFYNEDGFIVWEIEKSKFFLNIVAVDSEQAAVLWQSGRDEDGDRFNEIHVHNLKDGSVASVIQVPYSEILTGSQLNRGRIAMKTKDVYKRDIVILDTRTNKTIKLEEDFGIKSTGAILALKDNKLIVAYESCVHVISV